MFLRVSCLALGVALLLSPSPSLAEDAPASSPEIKRFGRVDTNLYRGGQPDAAGFEQLRQLGIRTVVNLRQDDDERRIVESLGLNYVAIPVSLPPFGDRLPDHVVHKFFEVLDDPASGAVFVHCRRGADRTGTLVGMYRIARQGWTPEDAYDEARDVGMRWWYSGMKGYLGEFAATSAAGYSPVSTPSPVTVR